MTQPRTPLSRAAVLLLTAAALPLTPLAAQEAETQAQPEVQPPAATQPTPEPFAVEVPPPITIEPIELPRAEVAPAPVAETPRPAAAAQAPAARRAPARPPARAATRAPARAAPAPAAAPVAAPAAAAPAPAPAEAAPPPAAEAVAPPPVAVPAAPAAAAPPAQPEQGGASILPWLIAGLLALGAAAFFLLRRRRRHAEVQDEPVYAEPVGHAGDASAAAATAFSADEPEEPAHAAAAPVEAGRPELDLDLRPRRAGVTGDDAIVEFELAVGNHGDAPARDVRVSTWLFPGGAAQASEMERALIEGGSENAGQADLSAVAPGSAERFESAVALSTSRVESDAVLPVVVAEARYTLPDGSEERTTASFAVGVPDGEELAHFAIENPSGLHDDVVAQRLDETV
ncbi:MAG TPA: LPXTG cell wall anchor domain-containing protein [Allosphingosinicella sp.]|jgi:LPXTG-motif cell wall-anchored protein